MLCLFSDLTPEKVTTYLEQNPGFLNDYVLKNASSDQVEIWYRKKCQHRVKTGHGTITRRGSSGNSSGSSVETTHYNGEIQTNFV